jgi:hypothetical protein
LNYFTGGYLVGYVVGKKMNNIWHSANLAGITLRLRRRNN